MKIFNIHGLSRSGNHAIIFWMIHNFVESVKNISYEIYIDDNYELCYINNMNIYEKTLKHNFPINQYKTVIKSYEDIDFNKDTSIIILRDFLNLLCSRYEKYQPNICLNTKYICDLLRLIKVWKQHSHAPNKTILYNSWISSKSYRDTICQKLIGIENTKDNISYIPPIGEGSSFFNNQYEQRYQQTKLPKYILDHLVSDKELIELNYKLFQIDILKIIKENYE